MAWFIIQCERKTWTKYLVEAKDKNAAMEESDNWQYLGHLDGDDTESTVTGGPFESKANALDDVVSYAEG
jgi:hypothetical protein